MSNRTHWEEIYRTNNADQLSWTQNIPQPSLDLVLACNLPKSSKIIDVGGGESNLVDFLVDAGYLNISVLDFSEESINRTKKRLGHKAEIVNWIVQDITEFKTDQIFDCWHDRAAFHFLIDSEQISKYESLANKLVRPNGFMIIGTFSQNGPEKCSGLPIQQYNENEMSQTFANGFKKINCISLDHETPFHTNQNFTYCTFQRINSNH